LIKTVEPMALLLCQARVGGDGSQEARGERRVDALEELEEEEIDRRRPWFRHQPQQFFSGARFTGISRTQAYSASR